MFARILPLHERTRRMICRNAFVVLCLVPTAAVAVGSIARQLPLEVAYLQRALSREFSVDARIGHIEHPRPGTMVLENVTLRDTETQRPLAHIGQIEARSKQGLLFLKAEQAELFERALPVAWQWSQQKLKRPTAAPTPLRWLIGRVVLKGDDNHDDYELRDVRGATTFTDTASQVYVRFTLDESPNKPTANQQAPSSEPATLRIIRSRESPDPTTFVQWQSGTAGVPCALLAPHLATQDWLGRAARYQGYIWASDSAAGWSAELAGVVRQLDLQSLVTHHFPHKLTGQATLRIERARIHSGRLIEAAGSFESEGGLISRSLLESASQSLRLGWGVPDGVEGVLPYTRLAISFALDSSGLSIQGACPGAASAVIVDRQRVLLAQPRQRQPVAALIRTLVPHRHVQVPASEEARWLVAHLPLERVVAPWSNHTPPTPAP